MPTSATTTYNSPNLRLDPWYGGEEDAEQQVVKLADGVYARGTVLGEKIGQNEVDSISIANATGGYFTVTMPATALGAGGTSAHIDYAATAADIEDAIEAIPGVGEGNVVVTDQTGGVFYVHFQGALSNVEVDTMSVTDATSGSGHSVAAAVVTDGDPGAHGTFAPYSHDNTDGTQHAKCILRYACTVSSGVVTGISDWGAQSVNAVPAFMRGFFRTEQLVGMDDAALTDLHATVVQGDLGSGVVRIG